MAENIIDLVSKQFKKEEGIIYSPSETKQMPISGVDFGGSEGFKRFKQQKLYQADLLNISKEATEQLIYRYGSNVDKLFLYIEEKGKEAKENSIDPILYAEILYAIHHECAYKPEDFFIRRTGKLFFDIDWVKENYEKTLTIMQKELDWSERSEEHTSELQSRGHLV